MRAMLIAGLMLGLGAAAPPTVGLRNGVRMPLISAGSGAYNASTVQASFTAALKVGFTALDTANVYNNQLGVARAIAGVPRGSFFLETKVPGCGVPYGPHPIVNPTKCYENTGALLEQNLQMLNTSYVDLVLLHYPAFPAFLTRRCGNLTGSCGMIRDQWRAMEDFLASGKAKAIGVSNYCPSCFACLAQASVQPMVNQLQYHVGMGPDPHGAVSFCKQHGCVVQAYGSLGNPPLDPRDPGPSKEILHGNLTSSIARNHNVSTVQVALKWIVSQGIPAVTKSGNPAHLAEDLDLWSWDLTPQEKQALDEHNIPRGSPSFACSS